MINETMKAHLRELFEEALQTEDLTVEVRDRPSQEFDETAKRFFDTIGRSLNLELSWERKS